MGKKYTEAHGEWQMSHCQMLAWVIPGKQIGIYGETCWLSHNGCSYKCLKWIKIRATYKAVSYRVDRNEKPDVNKFRHASDLSVMTLAYSKYKRKTKQISTLRERIGYIPRPLYLSLVALAEDQYTYVGTCDVCMAWDIETWLIPHVCCFTLHLIRGREENVCGLPTEYENTPNVLNRFCERSFSPLMLYNAARGFNWNGTFLHRQKEIGKNKPARCWTAGKALIANCKRVTWNSVQVERHTLKRLYTASLAHRVYRQLFSSFF